VLDCLKGFGGNNDLLRWLIAETVSVKDTPQEIIAKLQFLKDNCQDQEQNILFEDIKNIADKFENNWWSDFVS